jgi:hypothetical protein
LKITIDGWIFRANEIKELGLFQTLGVLKLENPRKGG